jgi:hypothetical protein
MNTLYKLALFTFLACIAAPALANDVIINGTEIDAQTKSSLEDYYRVRIPPGRYWYDPISGVWGLEGGPGQGQIHPGLKLGGPLRSNASNGTTGVFVNGRQLHYLEVAALQRCTAVIPGRYWIAANGVGGYEGGPPAFNLAVLCGRAGGGGSSTQCENYGNGQFNCSNSRTGIGMISEGGGKGAVFVDGKVIMTPN